MELNEKQFFKGFNQGYILAKYEPKLISILLKGSKDHNSYTNGIKHGQKEYELEYIKGHQIEINRLRETGRIENNKTIE